MPAAGPRTCPPEPTVSRFSAGVDGAAEDAFFASVRAIALPYGKRHFYAETYPASGVVAHAMAYRTPVVCTGYGSLAELDPEHGVVVVPPGADPGRLATEVGTLLNDEARLTELGVNADRTRQERSPARTAEAFVAVWQQLLDGRSAGV